MEIRMPGMEEVDTQTRIREKSPDVPVLLMSPSASGKQLEAAETGEAFLVLKKPVDIDSLLRNLSRFGTEETRKWKNIAC